MQITLLLLALPLLAEANPLQKRWAQVAPTGPPGSTTSDVFPPTGTVADTAAFPNESQLNQAGPTLTGAEPLLIATASALPSLVAFNPLEQPAAHDQDPSLSDGFNVVRFFGNLAPQFSVPAVQDPADNFGISGAGPALPGGAVLTGVHILFRHGARYPTSGAPPANFAGLLHNTSLSTGFNATGDLAFLNTWTFKLGAEVLTPFGRQQNFNFGVRTRQFYGELLNNFTAAGKLPVFRSESQDRMVKTMSNFAAGFFGIPEYLTAYNEELMVEARGYNNTGAAYDTCANANTYRGSLGSAAAANWTSIYLQDAVNRLQPQISGITLNTTNVLAMQYICAYETVALGYSQFCTLFTEAEFRGFEYQLDLAFWYNNGPGSPVAAAQGAGYVAELLSRLTQTRLTTFQDGINTTITSSPVLFPLDQSIYADATHEVIVLDVLTALNFTALKGNGPLPTNYIPDGQTFIASQIAPFATNLVVQIVNTPERSPSEQMRFIINDAVLSPQGIGSCQYDSDGFCAVDVVIAGLQARLAEINWEYDCLGNWTIANTTTGILDGRAPVS